MTATSYGPYGLVNSKLDITGPTVLKETAGAIVSMVVSVAGAAGAIYDCASTADAGTGTLVAVIPAAVGPVTFTFPCQTGITVVPGAGQVLAVAYQ